jgi:hypothetical protein
MADDKRPIKEWWVIVETRVLAVEHTVTRNPDERFLQAGLALAFHEMTQHFKTSVWTLESLTTNTYQMDSRIYVTFVLIGSVVKLGPGESG